MNGRDESSDIPVAHRLLRARDWQDRSQFGDLCDWWRGGYSGACALVGIGGAGTTAIADRFVRSLPGVLPTPDIAIDDTLTPPRALFDGRLRDLVLRAAEGWLPGASLLITSRFQLFDPLAERSPRFRQIPVEELTSEASVALLRQRGVRGPGHRLEALARDQGFHALSVDLLGGFIARFCGGDPAGLIPDAAVPAAGADVDPRLAALREQERRFARLAERYAEALGASDPAALALLQRACLFRLGADAATLASIFTGEGKEGVAGPELARLDPAGLEAKLALLAEMKLFERDDGGRCSVHPAVRDGFLDNLARFRASGSTRRPRSRTSSGLTSFRKRSAPGSCVAWPRP